MSQENVEMVRRAYEYAAAHRGEPDWDLIADDFKVANLPNAPWQPSPGKQGMREWVDFANEVAEEWVLEVDEIEDLGPEHVLVSGRLRMTFRSGIATEAEIVNLCQIRGGKFKRLEAYNTRKEGLEAAGLSE